MTRKLELKCEEQRLINNEDNEITRMYIPNPHLNYLMKTGNSNHQGPLIMLSLMNIGGYLAQILM